MPSRFRPLVCLVLVSCLVPGAPALAVPGGHPVPAPRKPAVAERSEDAPRAAAAFGLPAGFAAKLFAAEPDVANPVAFSVDERGRAYVCETFRQGRAVNDNRGHDDQWVDADLAARSVADRDAFFRRLLDPATVAEWELDDDRVRLLEDSDGDGAADTSTVWADGFNGLVAGTAAGILARRGEAWLTCIPALWRLRDLDGDGRVGPGGPEREALSEGYGVRVALRGHDLHGIVLGPDGRLYFSLGDRGYLVEREGSTLHDPGSGAVFRCEPDGSRLELFATSLRNPQELAFDDLGNLFTVDNNSDAGDQARLVHLLPGCDSGWNMAFQYMPDRGPWMREKLWHTAHEGQPAWIVPPLAHIGSGPSGFCFVPGTGLPASFDRRFLLCDFRGAAATSSIRSFRLAAKGASFEPVDQEEPFRSILATDVEVGPDGAIWASDWVHGWDGEGKGRLWRFVPEDLPAEAVALAGEVRRLLSGDWSAISPDRLGGLLGHPDRRVRLEAQWELVRRGETARLATIARDTEAPLPARVHAVQGLGQAARREGAATIPGTLLADRAWEIRLLAARALGDADGPVPAAERSRLVALLRDGELPVRAAAAIALGHIGRRGGPDPAATAALLAEADGSAAADPHLRHAVVMGLAGSASPATLVALAGHASPRVRLAAVVALRRLADGVGLATFLDDTDLGVAAEAARAIFDADLVGAWPALADRVASGPPDEAFLRRAVAAAEDRGSSADVAELLALAGRRDAPAAMRALALETLRTWAAPPSRSRVHGRLNPIPARDAAGVREALDRALPDLLASNLDDALRAALLEAAAELGVAKVAPLLADQARDRSRSPSSRAEALARLDRLGDAIADADRLLTDDSPVVRSAARRVRARHRPAAEVLPDLVAATGAADPRERQAAVDLLGSIDDPGAVLAVRGLAERLGGSERDPATEIEVVEAAQRRLGAEAAERIVAARAAGEGALAAWRDCLEGGDPDRGRSVFFGKAAVSCVRCHKAEGNGGEVGPPLDGKLAEKGREHLLESIVAPDAKVADAWRTTVILTDDGRTVAGIVTGEQEGIVSLRVADGTVLRIPAASIEERASGPSAMPADLAGKLTRRELRDLVAWLGSLR